MAVPMPSSDRKRIERCMLKLAMRVVVKSFLLTVIGRLFRCVTVRNDGIALS